MGDSGWGCPGARNHDKPPECLALGFRAFLMVFAILRMGAGSAMMNLPSTRRPKVPAGVL